VRSLVLLGPHRDYSESGVRVRGDQPGPHERLDQVVHRATIFGLLTGKGVRWKIYGYDKDPLARLDFPDTTGAPDANFGLFRDFQADAQGGQLPAYAFLEPGWGPTGNSQHPAYDVAKGEQLIHDVYRALRDGPGWNQTLLIVTYDEHGSCYDHVPPPTGAIPPDRSVGEYGFDFARFGVWVPTVLVSPLIAPGQSSVSPRGSRRWTTRPYSRR